MNKRSSTILITGGSGFIGMNIIEKLSENNIYSILSPSHNELDLLDSEKVKDFVNENDIDIIIHCANIGGNRRNNYDIGSADVVSKNLRMFFNLARTLDQDKKMIFLGSGAEYNFNHYKQYMNEDYFDTYVPVDDYGFSKYVCSKYIMNSENIVNLRLFGVFGKYEDYEYKFISNSIIKNLLGLPIIINQNVFFDYLYVDDLVNVINFFITHKSKYKFYNAVRGESIDLVSIAEQINKISEKPSKIIIKNTGLNNEYSGNNRRLLEEMPNIKFTHINKALAELYLWYKENLNEIDRNLIEKDECLKYCRTKS